MKLIKLHSREGREEFKKLVDDIHVGLVSYKLYGDKDKLKKPKTLKTTKQTWATKIIGRSASFFEMGDETYVKMGELFCRQMSFNEPIDMMLPLSALAKKYPHKFAKIGNRDKFVYSDVWCTIMELNTGWLRIDGLTKALSYDVCYINYSAIVSKLYGELFRISQNHEHFYHLDEYGSDFYSAAYYRFCDAIVNHYYHQLLNN